MATNPNPAACLKCATPLVPGAAFCGTCGTPAGATGTPPLPPPMPPRPLGFSARQVVVPMGLEQAMQAAAGAVAATRGEITNQAPAQIAFRTGSMMSGRSTGTVDAMPDAPGRTILSVTMKADYASLIPSAAAGVAILIGSYAYQQSQLYNPANYTMYGYTGSTFFLSPMMMFLIFAVAMGVSLWWLGGPLLEKRRTALLNALQSQGAMPPGVPGMPPVAGVPPMPGQPGQPAPLPGQGAPPQVTPFEQLRKLAELRDSGAISAADYEQAKAAIMARLS